MYLRSQSCNTHYETHAAERSYEAGDHYELRKTTSQLRTTARFRQAQERLYLLLEVFVAHSAVDVLCSRPVLVVIFAGWRFSGLQARIFARRLQLADVVVQPIFLLLRDIFLLTQAFPAPEAKNRRRDK